jgi:hypothetical protein
MHVASRNTQETINSAFEKIAADTTVAAVKPVVAA